MSAPTENVRTQGRGSKVTYIVKVVRSSRKALNRYSGDHTPDETYYGQYKTLERANDVATKFQSMEGVVEAVVLPMRHARVGGR